MFFEVWLYRLFVAPGQIKQKVIPDGVGDCCDGDGDADVHLAHRGEDTRANKCQHTAPKRIVGQDQIAIGRK